ncbi:hypothetical protein PoB_004612700 [Plakobranchus ocellatus]|uniref:Uncharacterized protein n=1 Tax=Plakobranchus ocellatus TaxID=259542 RepID=A0AAV4BL21_9GAST|nr:hypothetical protein PoB_004612700 [Plakobranchus ocellatus]
MFVPISTHKDKTSQEEVEFTLMTQASRKLIMLVSFCMMSFGDWLLWKQTERLNSFLQLSRGLDHGQYFHSWYETNSQEIRTFIGLTLLMGLIKNPDDENIG